MYAELRTSRRFSRSTLTWDIRWSRSNGLLLYVPTERLTVGLLARGGA